MATRTAVCVDIFSKEKSVMGRAIESGVGDEVGLSVGDGVYVMESRMHPEMP